jgi:hypothetical protein
MFCPDCYSSEFRISRFRAEDILHLVTLRYPLRCTNCNMRTYATLGQAIKALRRSQPQNEPSSK